ncbi:hypothetical protein, partial [Polynucleobacter sp.]|uniref:hypothetical protein n=1 Tax=Polynucleobacter sp. TaxID=2029855 RepID=UPI00301931A4
IYSIKKAADFIFLFKTPFANNSDLIPFIIGGGPQRKKSFSKIFPLKFFIIVALIRPSTSPQIGITLKLEYTVEI